MTDENPTIFGKILRGEAPADIVWEDEQCIAFRDISPGAPVHILIIPREYIVDTDSLKPGHEALIGHLVMVAAEIARKEGIAESGYRLVVNCHKHGGQTVHHLHFHLMGGRFMGWPPG